MEVDIERRRAPGPRPQRGLHPDYEIVSLRSGTRSDSQIFCIVWSLVLRMAAKYKLNAYFPIFLFNHVTISLEINQAGSSPTFPFSPLTVFTHNVKAPFGGSTGKVDTKHQKSFIGCLITLLHRSSGRNLDAVVPCRWLSRKVLKYYVKRELDITTVCDDPLPR